jgi:hypothetical protein
MTGDSFINSLFDIDARDICSATLKEKEVRFSTKIHFKSLSGIKHIIKNEVFTFENNEDATLFFYNITSDLKN